MNKLKIALLVVAGALACAASAQDTNLLRTQIGSFEAQTGVVIIKGINPVGSLPMGQVQLNVGYKETKDAGAGVKLYGLSIEVEGSQFQRERVLVDDDELDSLINAVNYLAKINADATPLGRFEANYTTKAGLSVIAESIRREGSVLIYIKFEDSPRIALSPVQMSQFYGLLQQGRRNLDGLKSAK
jgi:hypothetical protein